MPKTRVSLQSLSDKLELIHADVKDHIRDDTAMFRKIQESLDGCDEYPGVRGRLDRLEQTASRQKNYWKVLMTAVTTAAVAYGFTFFPK